MFLFHFISIFFKSKYVYTIRVLIVSKANIATWNFFEQIWCCEGICGVKKEILNKLKNRLSHTLMRQIPWISLEILSHPWKFLAIPGDPCRSLQILDIPEDPRRSLDIPTDTCIFLNLYLLKCLLKFSPNPSNPRDCSNIPHTS